MCGFAGIIDFNNSSSVSSELLKRMSDIITHRGPDSDGMWLSDDRKCGLTFRRLAIIDLSPQGNQPMHTSDGVYHIVFNGEIYNHRKLREEFIADGKKYHSNTDTETILYGFEKYGTDFLQKMIGMWAIAIWNSRDNELILARDRIGIKPLYYYYKDGKLIFGSEIKSILCHNDVKKELELNELPNYLNYMMSSDTNSLFKNIRKVSAGTFLKLNPNGDLKINQYWTPLQNFKSYTKLSEKEIQDEVMKLIKTAVEDRMMSDVPFGVFLSGGIDSSLNVALMSELMNRPVDTFTVGFKELEKYNELEYATQISKLFNTNHHEILIDSQDGLDVLEALAFHEDEPNGDSVCIPLYHLSKLTKGAGTTVIQVGEGSDEQFIGYDWMRREYNFRNSLWKRYTNLPDSLRHLGSSFAMSLVLPMGRYDLAEYFRRASEGEELYWSGTAKISPIMQESLFSSKYTNLSDIPWQFAKKMHNLVDIDNKDADYLQRMIYLELRHRLAELLLMRVDKITMAHSLESRVPFLDHRLVEFTMTIPPEIRLPKSGLTKAVLKKAVEGILPDNIIYRKKQGFAAPIKEWLRTSWYDFAFDTVINSYFIKENIFNKEFVEKIFVAHKTAKTDYKNEIFMLLMLSIWHNKFFGSQA